MGNNNKYVYNEGWDKYYIYFEELENIAKAKRSNLSEK